MTQLEKQILEHVLRQAMHFAEIDEDEELQLAIENTAKEMLG